MTGIKCGIDLVYIPTFRKSLREGGSEIRTKIFTEKELMEFKNVKQFACIFATKEAVIKALNLKLKSLRDIEVSMKSKNGPSVEINTPKHYPLNVSITQNADYILAICLTKPNDN